MRIYLNGETPFTHYLAEQVLDLLNGVEGTVDFAITWPPKPPPMMADGFASSSEIPILEGGTEDFVDSRSWSSHLEHIAKIRKRYEIPKETFLFEISEEYNDHNWFSFGDEKRNHYIHGVDWDSYTGTENHFPIAYLVASNTLMAAMFRNMNDMLGHLHQDTIGCISDLCIHKKDISMKMRTADVCDDCMGLLKTAITENRILGTDAQHLLRIMEAIRGNLLFRSRYELDNKPSRLSIRGYKQKIFLEDAGGIQVSLNPIQRTIYLSLLRHEEGINPYSIDEEPMFSEMCELYERVSGIDDPERIRESVTSWAIPEAFNQHISRIRRVFRRTLGDELAEPYLPVTEEGVRKVKIDRTLILKTVH